MNAKNIAIGGNYAGIALLIFLIFSGYLVNLVRLSEISPYGGIGLWMIR